MLKRRPWREELAIIDRTMKAISDIHDPEELVTVYWDNIGELIKIENYVSVSRRGIEPPDYLVTRSSRFTESINPWTERDRLPKLTGGILGEIAYADQPVVIDDLSARLSKDDPAYFYLEGFESLVALPQYDANQAMNVTSMLFKKGQGIDEGMIPMLHWQSGLFGRGTQNLVLRNQLADVLATLDKEMQAVGEIQKTLLPETLPSIPGFEVAAYYQTSARAGGDYYDFFNLDDGTYGLFIADVSGHGTPAAVLMAITHAIAHAKPSAHTPPDKLLKYLNDRLTHAYTRAGTFVTAFYAILDPKTHTLTYARAGHNPPRLVRNGCVLPIDGEGGLPLGIVCDATYSQATLQLQAGDKLLLYTDGITEAMAPTNGEGSRALFGTERLDALLLECGSRSADECISQIREAVTSFSKNAMPGDDQTLIMIQSR